MTDLEHKTVDKYLERLAVVAKFSQDSHINLQALINQHIRNHYTEQSAILDKLEEMRHDFNILQSRLNELWLAAIRAGWRLHPEEGTPRHGLPRHYTGGDPALIEVPEPEPLNRHDIHEQQQLPQS